MKENTKKVFIKNFGCQMNVRDSEVVAGLLKQSGYALADDAAKADIVIFNTCSVRQHAEDKVWSEIGRIAKLSRQKQKKPKTRKLPSGGRVPVIGLIGCMAQNYKEQAFQRCPEVDFVVGPSDIEKIPEILARVAGHKSHEASQKLYELKVWETDGVVRPEEIYHTGFYEDAEHAYVVISEGCSNFCSYCVVPHVRGGLHNRGHHAVIREIEGALAHGITRVTLLGQNVNAYESPVKGAHVDFMGLLKMVNQIEGIKEFGFITSHPRDTTVDLFKAMAECGKLKKYLHLPIQSGSDKILQAMNRGYTRKFYLDLIDKYRTIVTGGKLSTDIIVGFPGETRENFQDTVSLVKNVLFDAAYIFKYSPRPHTSALALSDDVPKIEKEQRHAHVLAMQKEISKKKNAKA